MTNTMYCQLGCGRVNTTRKFRCEGCGKAAQAMTRLVSAPPAQLGFIGEILFDCYCEDQHQDRRTSQMTFEVMTDWLRSCDEYYSEMVRCGDYDGCEIFVNVYELIDKQSDFRFEECSMVDQLIISI